MTTQSNIFRLQRLNKTMKLSDTHHHQPPQQKQSIHLAAINSISRGIKYNDVSFMSGRNLNILRKQPDIGDDIQYQCAHHNLQGVRKNYDSTHNYKNKRQNTIAKLQEQKRKLSINEVQLRNKRSKGDQLVKKLSDTLQKTRTSLIQLQMQKKVLQNMKDRLKSDRVVYDFKKYNLQQSLKLLKKQKHLIQVTRNDYSQSDDRTTKVYKKYLQQIQKQQQQRISHIKNIQCMIQQKQRVSQVNDFRTKQMQDIAEKAMQDKDDNEKKWFKIYFASRVISKLLRDKMNRQMQKFITVQTSFKTIKIQTGVIDADSFTDKFLNKQQTYGQLLSKIAQNQKNILLLKQQGDTFSKQFKILQTEKQIIDHTKKPSVSVQGQLKKLTEMDKKLQNSQLYRQKVRIWLCKTNKKMNSILNSQLPTTIQRTHQAITTTFIQYLSNLSKELDSLNDVYAPTQNKNDEQIPKQNKLIRIKCQSPKTEYQEDQFTIDHSQQNDQISIQRIQILRSNERFMRDVRKKYDEKRKLAVAEANILKKKIQTIQKPPPPLND